MKTWEYEQINSLVVGGAKINPDLNEMGVEGWEAVGILPNGMMLMKRETTGQTPEE